MLVLVAAPLAHALEERKQISTGQRRAEAAGRGDSAYRLHRHWHLRHRCRLKIEDTICILHHQAVGSPVVVQSALVAFNRHGAVD